MWLRICSYLIVIAVQHFLQVNGTNPTQDHHLHQLYQRRNRRSHHYLEHQVRDPKSVSHNKHGHLALTAAGNASSTAAAALTPQSAPLRGKLPIVYVFTVVPAICPKGLPTYIKHSLEQGIYTQPDCDVILVSNYADCAKTEESVSSVTGLVRIDSTKITSQRTRNFVNASTDMFQTDGKGELWLTSALRFFMMEDMMEVFGYSEMIHVETDNLLYGKMTSLLPTLRADYHGIAATPLMADKSFITASVFWVSRLSSLVKFNNYLLNLGSNRHMMWKKYLRWMRQYACCKPGGLDPDANGVGIKPFAVNEMSMLAYYHQLHPQEFKLLPVVPAHDYITNRYVINMSHFAPEGREIPAPTGHGIWDPNSWGQFIGGTASKGGRDKRFTDAGHIAGQAIRLNQCEVKILCGNQTSSPYAFQPSRPPAPMRRLNEDRAADGVIIEVRIVDDATNETRLVLPITVPHRQPNDEAIEAVALRIRDTISDAQSKLISGRNADASAAAGADSAIRNSKVVAAVGAEPKLPIATSKASSEQSILSFEQVHRLEFDWYDQHQESSCYTAPFVRCGESSIWTPLWNLHVHGKQTQDYRSEPCQCAAPTSGT